MPSRLVLDAAYPAVAISAIFAVTLRYTGAGYNLHWLSLAGFLLFLWLARSLAKADLARMRMPGGWLPVVIVAYLGWLFLAPFASTYPYASSTTAMGLAVLPLMFTAWLILPVKDKQAAWRVTWRLLLLCAVALALWGIADFLVQKQRAHASFLDPSAYGALLNLFILPAAYAYLTAPAGGRRFDNPDLLLYAVALLALAQSMTLSRGALLSLLAILPVLLWSARSHPAFRRRLPWLLVVLASAYLIVQFAPSAPRQSADTLVPGTESDSVQGRLLLLQAAARMLGDSNLLYGTGLGTFKTYYSAYRDEGETSLGNFVHNDYLQALLEGGLIQLGFFLGVTVVAPVWMLRKKIPPRSPSRARAGNADITPGLLFGIAGISLHALLNFIHFVGPIALLTGLYLARSWETTQALRSYNLARSVARHVQPAFVKSVAVLLLAVPTAVLAVDGVIFKLFATHDSIHTRLEPGARMTALNLALAARPGNPTPRIFFIRALLLAAEKSPSAPEREMLLKQAERETAALSASAPALAIGQYFFTGKILALKGTPNDLLLARDDLERAVKLVPPATTMRLELVKVYRRLGQEKEAYQTVVEAKKWIRLEVDPSSLAAFAKEAHAVALSQKDDHEAAYWSRIYTRLAELGHAG